MIEIGLSCSPSTIISNELIKCKRILVSFGGGMGGANITHYCTKVSTLTKDGYLNITLITGEKREINPKFIVEKADINIVKLVTDITQHINYNKPSTVTKEIETEFIRLLYNEDYVIINKYTPRHTGKLENAVVHKFVTKE